MGERITNKNFCPSGGGWTFEHPGDDDTYANYFSTDGTYCWWYCGDWWGGNVLGISQVVDLTNVSNITLNWDYLLAPAEGQTVSIRVYVDASMVHEATVLHENTHEEVSIPVSLTGNHTISLVVVGDTESVVEVYGNEISAIGSDLPPAPVAAFTGSPLTGEAPLTVAFTDLSTGSPTEWLWSFGDGNLSTEQNPTHVYNEPGEYTVNLKTTNAGGFDTEQKDKYITVTVPPRKAYRMWTFQFGPD